MPSFSFSSLREHCIVTVKIPESAGEVGGGESRGTSLNPALCRVSPLWWLSPGCGPHPPTSPLQRRCTSSNQLNTLSIFHPICFQSASYRNDRKQNIFIDGSPTSMVSVLVCRLGHSLHNIRSAACLAFSFKQIQQEKSDLLVEFLPLSYMVNHDTIFSALATNWTLCFHQANHIKRYTTFLSNFTIKVRTVILLSIDNNTDINIIFYPVLQVANEDGIYSHEEHKVDIIAKSSGSSKYS